ncbi:MAG: hypothetical protein ACLSA6_19140 [Holdemania massiliensis]
MAHNTVVLDDQPGSIPFSWTYQKFLRPLATVVRDTPQALYWEGGVLTQQPQMTHIRKIIMLPQDAGLSAMRFSVRVNTM